MTDEISVYRTATIFIKWFGADASIQVAILLDALTESTEVLANKADLRP